ncbi:PAAR domain-containing protein [Paraburkholderia phenazinium]|jgi:uncharacterized Zn-binding protein involved in type VI secretion|uniref:Zn-binding Pro-Ala-Ala-Arg (PAAR) domain-containing protein, incolved in TypeVI secretion n=1 Tax=Paraburkholderia phenazinium TaxID=60549 RepID=A0A1G7U201_9BURK|nr:Zn-binding Pro-Ala-Ala-Arg (PAAR) domain-containing protein, incolved in TypeVI secretion [Paraburkholderia phenazinium]
MDSLLRYTILVLNVMKKLAYEGDSTSHGGKILTGSDRVKIKGRRAARIGDRVSCPLHGENEIVEGGTSMTDAGTPLSRDGDKTQCGSFLIAASEGATVR